MLINKKIRKLVYVLTVASLLSGCSSSSPSAEKTEGTDKVISRLLYDDMHAQHECKPHGVPSDYNWCAGPVYKNLEFPTTTYYETIGPHQWNAFTIWGQVYEAVEGTGSINTRVQIKNINSYYLSSRDNQWHEAQSQVSPTGAGYVEDFSKNDTEAPDARFESDGSISVIPGGGYNYHFYPSGRAEIEPGEVLAICGSVSARLIKDNAEMADDRDEARFILNVGCDIWYDLSASWDNFNTNGDTGIGRFRYVKKDWQLFTMYSTKEGIDLESFSPPPVSVAEEK